MKRKLFCKSLAFFVSLLMVFSSITITPLGVFADEEEPVQPEMFEIYTPEEDESYQIGDESYASDGYEEPECGYSPEDSVCDEPDSDASTDSNYPAHDDSDTVVPMEEITIIFDPVSVTINDANPAATVTVGGTATGTVSINTTALPTWVSASVSGDVITVTGTRPPAHTANPGSAVVPVTRQGETVNLSINFGGITALPTADIPICSCGAVRVGISVANPGQLTAVATIANHSVQGFCLCPALSIPGTVSGIPVIAIGAGAFRNTSIPNIVLPSSVIYIGDHAFAGTTAPGQRSALTSITLNHGLQTIGRGAFYRTNLTSITIPNTVTRIASGAGAVAPPPLSTASSAFGIDLGGTTSDRTFGDNPFLRSITIGTGLNRLEPGIFYEATGLTSITVPGNVQIVGDRAFWMAGSLARNEANLPLQTIPLNLAQGIQQIHRGAFFGVPIAELVIPNSITRIASGSDALNQGTQTPPHGTMLNNEAIPPSATDINNRWHRSFGHNPHLTSVTIGTGLDRLEPGIFYDTPGLTTITIPGNVRVIGERAFRVPGNFAVEGRGISTLTLNEGLVEIHRGAFFGAPITELKIPDSVTRIISGTNGAITNATGTHPFTRFGSELTLESSPPTSAQLAVRWHMSFGFNPFLKEIHIGTGLRIIEPGLFYNSLSLETLHLGSVNDIRNRAFHNAGLPTGENNIGSLRSITWNPGAYEGDAFIHPEAFRSDAPIVGNPLPQINNVCTCCGRLLWTIYRNVGATITRYLHVPGPILDELRIPERVSQEPNSLAFTAIGYQQIPVAPHIRGAFEANVSLNRVYLPESGNIHTIYDRAFFAATQLRHIELPEGLRDIGRGAFFYAGLYTVTIPNSVTRIRSGYTPVVHNTIHGTFTTPPTSHPTNHQCPFDRPNRPLPSCLTHRARIHRHPTSPNHTVPDNWTTPNAISYDRQGGGTTPPPATGPILESYAFGRNHSLHTITIGTGLEVIEPGTFYDARELVKLDLGNVRIIGDSAFEFWEGFTSDNIDITWSERLEIIGPRAFYNARHIGGNGEGGIDFAENSPTLYSIRQRAFRNASQMRYLRLNDRLTTIHRGAFNNVAALQELVIPDSVTRIYSGGDFGANDVLGVPVPGVPVSTLGEAADWTFGGATALTSVKIGNNTHPIGPQLDHVRPGTFRNAASLRSVDLGRVSVIGAFAFENAPILDNITWGPFITHIHDNAFAGSRISGGIVFPDTLRRIHDFAFADASGLVELVLNQGLDRIGHGAFRNAAQLRGQPVDPNDRTGDWHLVIPNTVVNIYSANEPARRTFGNNTALTAVRLGNSLTDIHPGTFFDAPNLLSLHIGNNVRTIGHSAFSGAVRLHNISWGAMLDTIGEQAFLNMGSLNHENHSSITFPPTLRTIGPAAFRGASGIRVLNLNNGLITIDTGAFYGASRLEQLTIPNSVMTFNSMNSSGNRTFGNASALTHVTIGANILDIPPGAFYGATNLQNLNLANVITIGEFAFNRSGRLDNITWGDRITGIGANAFANSGITTLKLPPTMLTLGNNAFADAAHLERLELNNGLTTIGHGAFRNATSLRGQPKTDDPEGPWHLVIPNSVITINSGTNTGLPTANSAPDNRAFGNATALTALDVGAGLRTVQPGTFWGATSLESVNLRGVERIEAGAFRGVSAANPSPLAEITWGPVNYIGVDAFRYNSGLESLTLPSSMRIIDNHAFTGARGLVNLVLNDGLDEIGMGAFSNAVSLTGVLRIPDSVSVIRSGNNPVDRTFGGQPLGVGQFANSLDVAIVGKNLTAIPPGMFAGSGISSVSLGTGVTSIGNNAFEFAGNLKVVTFLGAAPTLGTNSFVRAHYPEDFTIRYLFGTTGWSTPTWQGLPAVPMGASVPVDIRLTAPSSMSPGNNSQLTAEIFNQHGDAMSGVPVIWTIDGTREGVSITNSGLINVHATAIAGPVWVRATTQTDIPLSVGAMIWIDGLPFAVSIAPAGGVTLQNAFFGYTVQNASTITISNSGTQPTGPLTIALEGAGASNFTATPTLPHNLTNLNVGGNASVTVMPVLGLPVGTHTATLTVTGTNIDTRSIQISFTVLPEPVLDYNIRLNPSGIDFPSVVSGFTAVALSPVNIEISNTGSKPTGPLTVRILNTTTERFTLSALSTTNVQMLNIPSIDIHGKVNIPVSPRAMATPAGVHNAIVTVFNDEVASSIPIRFEVLSDGAPRITRYNAPNGSMGTPYGVDGGGFRFLATGIPVPTWSATGLPDGLIITPAGHLHGIPLEEGVFNVTIIATSSSGVSHEEIEIEIGEAIPVVTTFTVGNTFASPGGEVTVGFRLNNNPGIDHLQFRVDFHESLTLVGYETYGDFAPHFIGIETPAGGLGALRQINAGWMHHQNIRWDGTIFSLTFKVAENTPLGVYPVTVTFVNQTGDPSYPTSVSGPLAFFEYSSGSVRVQDFILGDANGDGVVDGADVTNIARYLVGHNVPAIDRRASDTNCDGIVTLADATRLQRYLFGFYEKLCACS
ncbi:MAG: leucine-rich repeat protein [Defluviitaleaceae bacterium]|nr:leucine-rich repeat protein [Defluviitaleaceae bacterium]